jgi:hypothetical protein
VNIEPQGLKKIIHWDSNQGMEYGSTTDPRGPVGLTTIFLAEMRAIGDRQAAAALAISNQEAIDQAKRQVDYTDWTKICPFMPGVSAIRDEKGMFQYHFPGSNNTREQKTEDFPLKQLQEWRLNRLIKAGLTWRLNDKGQQVLTQNVLGWRIHEEVVQVNGQAKRQRLRKRIDYTQWKSTREKQNGCLHQNLVHVIADTCLDAWLKLGGSEIMDTAQKVCDLYPILPAICKAKGIPWSPPTVDWKTFQGLLKKAGITQYKADIKSVMVGATVEVKSIRIEQANAKMTDSMAQISIVEIQAMWEMIHRPWVYAYPNGSKGKRQLMLASEVPSGMKVFPACNPLDLYRALATERSWWATVVSETAHDKCHFLDTIVNGGKYNGLSRLVATMAYITSYPDPAHKLAELVANNTSHGNEIKSDEGHSVEMWQCAECRERLRYALASTLRSMRTSKTNEFLKRMTTTANQAAKLGFEPIYGASLKGKSETEWEESTQDLYAMYEEYQGDEIYAMYDQ